MGFKYFILYLIPLSSIKFISVLCDYCEKCHNPAFHYK